MTFGEALKAFSEGKKIRRKGFLNKLSYQFKDGALFVGGNPSFDLTINGFDLEADDWEVVEEVYITKDEKEYLENLLRLYRDDFNFTFEKVMRNGHLYLKIVFIPYDEDDIAEIMLLPLFGLNKPMFEGLETNYCYNADYLKLFKGELYDRKRKSKSI